MPAERKSPGWWYVKEHRLNRVVCLSIDRLGRNTLEALKVINYLNENGVSLYIKNYNLNTLTEDGKVNPVASLICTILHEIASIERLTIKERMASGRDQYIAKCRREGVKMGRPYYKVNTKGYPANVSASTVHQRYINLLNQCRVPDELHNIMKMSLPISSSRRSKWIEWKRRI